MIALDLSTDEQFGKVFDYTDFINNLSKLVMSGVKERDAIERILTAHLEFTDETRKFLYEHDLYYPAQWSVSWTIKEDNREFFGKFYLPSLELATLFKLQVM